MAQLDQNLCRIEEKNKKKERWKDRREGKICVFKCPPTTAILHRIFPQIPLLLHYSPPNLYGPFGLLTFSMSFRNKTTYTDATLAPSTFSLYNYIPLLFSLPLSSIPILIHVLGLRLFLLCFISKFCLWV